MMRSDWKEVTLKDIADNIQYGYTTSALREPVGPKLLRITDIVPELINWNSVPYCKIAEEDIQKYKLREGDIVIARTGATTGYAKQIKGNPNSIFASYLVRVQLISEVDKGFIGKIIESTAYKKFIQQHIGGAAQPNANAQILTSFPINLPPLSIQQKIAGILSAYDNLIENNTRRIQILEEMTQRIYREWFVNFLYPGFEENKLIKSELGMIPEGWDVKTVSKAVKINPRISVPRGTNKPYVPMSGLNKNTMLITEYEIRKGNSGSKFQNKDVLMARITPSLEHGKTAYVQFLGNDSSIAIGSTEFIVMRSKSLNSYFVYCLARNEDFREHAIKSMVGASGRQRVQMECFDSFLFAHPDNDSLIKFSFIAEPIFRLIHRLWDGIQKHRKIRDFLLPKLISGKIDLSERNIDIGVMNES